jgi:hypothetical protein
MPKLYVNTNPEVKDQKELKDTVTAMKPLNPSYSATVKITGMLEGFMYGEHSETVYEVSPEEATAAIAVIEEHSINVKPVSLTPRTANGQYLFRENQVNTGARHLPSHTTEGDVLEISDLKTHETYKLKVSKNFYSLCHAKRPNSWQSDATNAATIKSALQASIKVSK